MTTAFKVRVHHPDTGRTSFAMCPYSTTTKPVVIDLPPAIEAHYGDLYSHDRAAIYEAAIQHYQQHNGATDRPFVLSGFVGAKALEVIQSVRPSDAAQDVPWQWCGVGGITVTVKS